MIGPVGGVIFALLVVMTIIVLALYFRYRKHLMFHQERLTAMEKGVPVPDAYTPGPWSPRVYLLRGLQWALSGIALTVFLLGIALSTQRPASIESTVFRAKRLAESAGISIDEAKTMIEQNKDSRLEGMPSSVALLGLIPVSIGVAYLIFYYTRDRRGTDSPGQDRAGV
jgi:hypothetical protein